MKNNWNRDKYIEAWDFATLKHRGQVYGAKEEGVEIDYINHIGAVSMEIMWFLSNSQNSYNADLALHCAILHDTLEDTQTDFAEIEELFGKQVANGVLALTKDKNLPKDKQMTDSLMRIQQQPKEVWLVKMADRVSNLCAPPFYWKNEKIISYQKEAETIYNALASADSLMAERLMERIKRYSIFLK